MGFSLEMFLNDLKEILASDLGNAAKLEVLKATIAYGETYARECGAI